MFFSSFFSVVFVISFDCVGNSCDSVRFWFVLVRLSCDFVRFCWIVERFRGLF